ncbi:hypothetical protein DY000_02061350 [Brassica cretica]|uniref:Secreted protein n=1 Tax=Brassica cretica TaxID=69181 RepID=A0ABQ7AYY8_BRACR|nr:hypothetical protein DY000_02061350 [Brassica cretica]
MFRARFPLLSFVAPLFCRSLLLSSSAGKLAFLDVVRISACFGGHVRVGLLICCFHPVFGFDGECSCLSPSLVFGSGVYDTRAALPFPDNHSAAACLCGISS